MNNRPKIGQCLITGGAGFIGSSLASAATAVFESVVVIDNLVNGKWKNIHDADTKNVECVEGDIRDTDVLSVLLKKADVVYHLACLGVRHSIHSPRENHDVNSTATLDLLALAREAGVKRFVYVSSSEIYGTARQAPITEETPAFPHTVYGSSKLAGDCYTRAYWDTYRFPTTVLRPFNSYGPRCHHEGDSGEVIPKFMLRALAGKPLIIFGDGTQTRDFMYVEETAHWILEAGLSDQTIGQTLNLGVGQEISVRDLADTVLRVTGNPNGVIVHEEPRPGDVLRLWADASKARKLLGYSPQVSLDNGLQRLLEWYRSQDKTPEQLLADEVVKNWE